ncbi:type II/IV secretion system protein [candidate division KSB1 bacterium]|nr:type II/IV secretion system protein [candidate division KSB1 bacterium]
MTSKSYNRIIDHLLHKQIIQERMVQEILPQLQENGKQISTHTLLEALIDKYQIDRHTAFSTISALYAFKQIRIDVDKLGDEQIDFIRKLYYDYSEETREAMAQKKMLPFRPHETNRNILLFIAADPIDRDIYPLIRQTKDYSQFEVAYVRLEEIEELIQRVAYIENEFLKEIEESLSNVEMMDEDSIQVDEAALDAEINRSMLTNLIEGALVEAVRKSASDIHFVPQINNVTHIHFRIDGKLQLWHSLEKIKPEAVAAVIKDRSKNIDRFDRSIAQDGFIQRKIDGYFIRFRVSVLPIVSTEFHRSMESIVIRVLDDRKVIVNLDELGLQKQAADDFRKAIVQPQGMVILTGPTGSGKSTTLVAALQTVKDDSKNILTVEEPVEYLINGVRQLRLSPKMSFEQALRSILRHDPDIVMVGEMRDLQTANIGVALANTGHLTFSTLHTNDAPSAISRLYMLGVETFLIANAINLVMAQRLVRKLCPHCKRPSREIDADMAFRIGFKPQDLESTTIYEPVGCSECYGGYKGRVAIMEALYFTKEIRHIIINSKDSVDEEAIRDCAIQNGMLTLRESGKRRVLNGITTCEEIVAATTDA